MIFPCLHDSTERGKKKANTENFQIKKAPEGGAGDDYWGGLQSLQGV